MKYQLRRSIRAAFVFAVTNLALIVGIETVAAQSDAWSFTTLAGRAGVNGTNDGVGTNALFFHPGLLALDNSQNIYVADTANRSLRKITPAGAVTTLTNTSQVAGVAVDSTGSIFVLEWNYTQFGANSGIKKINADGSSSNVWTGLNRPEGIAVDSAGTMYVSVSGGNVQKKTTDGTVSPVAGGFTNPQGLAVDTSGNVYIADPGANTIDKVSPNGFVTTIAGSTGHPGSLDGPSTSALFNGPNAVAVDAQGTVYVTDSNNDTIRRITADGYVSTIGGVPSQSGSGDGYGTNALFSQPSGIAVDISGNLYISDYANNTIRFGLAPQCAVPPSGIVAWWPGNESFNDVQGTNNAIPTSVLFGAGKADQAFVLDGTNSFLNIPSSPTLDFGVGDFTIEAWANLSTLNQDQTIFHKLSDGGQSYLLEWARFDPHGSVINALRFVIFESSGNNNDFYAPAPQVQPGQWFHIVGVRTGSTNQIYLNGTLLLQQVNGNNVNTGTGGTARIGNLLNGGRPFSGSLDEISLYNRALSASEIQVIYAAGSAGKCLSGQPPTITASPVGQTTLLGTNITLNVSGAGFQPLSYQWRRNGTNLAGGSIFTGVTTSILVISNAQFDQLGAYSAVVNNLFGSATSGSAIIGLPDVQDDDHDAIPNWWETTFGLNPANGLDATNYPPGDRLTYLQKYLYGLDPTTIDTDGDGLTDYDEIFVYHTNPLRADTDGDGIPDKWELDHGMNPLVDDATQVGSAGVTMLQIYQYDLPRQRPPDQLDPRHPFFAPGTSVFEVLNNGQHTNRFYYDKGDRLTGVEYSRGISIAYFYDGNGNPVRKTTLARSAETNALPVLWLAQHNLPNRPGIAYEDEDGDGWSNYQEWQAGTDPTDASSVPSLTANSGINVAAFTVGFTPSKFVMCTGDVDGIVGDEIVVGADGILGTNINALLILTQATNGWTTQKVNIGSYGVTSVAVGQAPGRSFSAIYCGLRSTTGTNGAIAEIAPAGTNWQTTVIATSPNSVPIVSGIITNQGVVAVYCPSNTSTPYLYAIAGSTNAPWAPFPLATNALLGSVSPLRQATNLSPQYILAGESSSTTLWTGIIQSPFTDDFNRADGVVSNGWVQSPNAGSLTIQIGRLAAPNANNYGDIFRPAKLNPAIKIAGDITDTCGAIPGGLRYQSSFGLLSDGSLSNSYRLLFSRTDPNYTNSTVSLYDRNSLVQSAASTFQFTGTLHVDFTMYSDGSVVGSVFGSGGLFNFSFPPRTILSTGTNFIFEELGSSSCQPQTLDNLSIISQPQTATFTTLKPTGSNQLLGGGTPVCALLRTNSTNGISVCYAGVDGISARFIVAEYGLSNSNETLLTLTNIPIGSSTVGQHFGIACADFLNNGSELLFTGEPDGRIFVWSAGGATNGLRRQLFCPTYYGKAWHTLAAVRTTGNGVGLAGVMVDLTNANTANVVFWKPQTTLPVLTTVNETAPSAAVLPTSNPLGPVANLTTRIWDNEGNASTPFVQYQLSGTTNWISAAITKLDATSYSPQNRVSASPSGINHTLTWNVMTDLGTGVVTNVLLRARAQDSMLTGDWSVPTPFQINMTQDSNTNGIPDWWEYFYFGSLQPGPGDYDGDGVSNYSEYIADTDPTDASSYPKVSSVQLLANSFQINWSAGQQSRHILQMSLSLSNQVWMDIFTNQPNALSSSYIDAGTNAARYYRLRFERP